MISEACSAALLSCDDEFSGGAGWGDPFERDPERVLRDVRDEYVTIAAAEREFGVVISGDPHTDPEGLVLDLAATENARAARG
jgi:N-methylhydantoinase B